jgi:hypothetical protein
VAGAGRPPSLLLDAVAAAGQLIGSFGILLSLTFLKALSLKRLPVYLRQYAAEGSALGMFERRRAVSANLLLIKHINTANTYRQGEG